MFLGLIDDIDDDFRMGPVPVGVDGIGIGQIGGMAGKSKGEVSLSVAFRAPGPGEGKSVAPCASRLVRPYMVPACRLRDFQ
ncbi:hypothetical protein GCM10007874_26320 [Labrys miyagiensis]|uniref:Uncharacterized protein n=1 Tax=Labrys miyagiensis TaxID=346912 RepID=A0ABQ6CL61_9HYPH|nr:hypothetical protein GCM10007874_26320 [Labrys miyagiensis]